MDYKRPFLIELLEEKKMIDHSVLMNDFGFIHMAQVTAQGNSGCMVMMWNVGDVLVDQIRTTDQEIHAMVKVNNSSISWLLSVIYLC